MPRVILVDDEPSARRGLRRLLAPFEDIEIIGEASGVDTARDAIAELRPDAVFLDIELTDGKGFEIVNSLPANVMIIVVSAYDLYAIDAFDAAAIDFLVKPIEPERLETAINRLRQRYATQSSGAVIAPENPIGATASKIHLKTTTSSMMVSTDGVSVLTAEGDYTRVHLETGQSHLVTGLLRKFELELPSPPFSRLDRSLIVNLNHIQEVEWEAGGRSRLAFGPDSDVIELGRSGSRRLRGLLRSPRPE